MGKPTDKAVLINRTEMKCRIIDYLLEDKEFTFFIYKHMDKCIWSEEELNDKKLVKTISSKVKFNLLYKCKNKSVLSAKVVKLLNDIYPRIAKKLKNIKDDIELYYERVAEYCSLDENGWLYIKNGNKTIKKLSFNESVFIMNKTLKAQDVVYVLQNKINLTKFMIIDAKIYYKNILSKDNLLYVRGSELENNTVESTELEEVQEPPVLIENPITNCSIVEKLITQGDLRITPFDVFNAMEQLLIEKTRNHNSKIINGLNRYTKFVISKDFDIIVELEFGHIIKKNNSFPIMLKTGEIFNDYKELISYLVKCHEDIEKLKSHIFKSMNELEVFYSKCDYM